MRNAIIVGTALCIVLAAAIWIFKGPFFARKPDILLITLDTTRLDHLSCYGYPANATPSLDMLASEGVRYERAISTSSWTLPAHASIFTGMLPTDHSTHMGVNEDGKVDEAKSFSIYTLHPMIPTLAGELRKAGYYTRGIIAGPSIHSQFGVGRGFDYYDDHFPEYGKERDAKWVTFLATKWLKEHCSKPERKPFFLFLNYFDPHSPYQAPTPWGDPEVPNEITDIQSDYYNDVSQGWREVTEEERRVLLRQYKGEVRFMDSQIGHLFDKMKQLGVYDSTLIVAVSDHGEMFGEHGFLGHGRVLYEELVRVPMIIKYPLQDNKRGLIVEHPVSLSGIMPTILEYVGQPIPPSVEGKLLKAVDHVLISEIFRDLVLIGSHGDQYDRDLKAIYDGEFKWIWHSKGEHELYDLSQDPEEKHNLHGKRTDIEKKLHEQLESLIEQSQKQSSLPVTELDEEIKQRLRALGYIR